MRVRPTEGLQIDGFTLGAQLHKGGFATVWDVTHPDQTLPMVMKVPTILDGDDAPTIVGFEVEQMIMPRLSGVHVPKVVAIGDFAVMPYVVTERIPGDSLLATFTRAPLPMSDLLEVMARMAVDAETGEPRIERLVWVDDAGRIISPQLAEGQLLGGLAQGLGQAMLERIVYDDDGQLLTGSLMDYAIPRADEMPLVELESLATTTSTNTSANLLGAKGVGEAGCIGVPAALLNAAADALSPLGEKTLDFPLTAERLWRAMQAPHGDQTS